MNLHKIGAVSSLSGVPTPTLRIWEARYKAFTPQKTASKHRLYSEDDVLKATLMKRLTDQGHGVSQIAHSSLQELNQLLQKQQSTSRNKFADQTLTANLSAAVVGLTLASRLGSTQFTQHFGASSMRLTNIFAKMEDMMQGTLQEVPQLLFIQCHSLHAGVQLDIRRLAEKSRAAHTIVLYSFGQEPVIDSLKQLGMIVRREPIPDSELSELVHATQMLERPAVATQQVSIATIPPRKYDDMALMRAAAISTQVLCECPKHVAELITQLARFEQYSLDCLNKSKDDARIHAHLTAVSGTARAMFEEALEMVAKHEGIELQAMRN